MSRYNDQIKVRSIDEQHTDQHFASGRTIPAGVVQIFTSTTVVDKITQPYWLETPHSLGVYNIADQKV
ncbi:hypothetical protein HK413_07265 [Mucilaginibacter sp. S1162]|uniref:Uncharacterized protein n=1 Tax=Mucilaginibacter humi TaxID=2732510 RepID=A0ABX1W5Z6_9SPHI|nr:hypothetical protein [Mucilaginibacter humi]NNU34006.1 hypothetical protein [Mucilaginibacter humi]